MAKQYYTDEEASILHQLSEYSPDERKRIIKESMAEAEKKDSHDTLAALLLKLERAR